MADKFFSQLFDAPAEIVVAHGRVVLTTISLAATYFDPTTPPAFAPLVLAVLIVYATYALAMLAALHWRVVENPSAILVHLIDLTTLALLLVVTDGLSSPFLVFFPFVLLAAALRWDWHGTAYTMAALTTVAAATSFLDFSIDGEFRDTQATIIRAGYLIVMGTALAYASAHREFERARLMRLARQSSAYSPTQGYAALAFTLCEAAGSDQQALAIWKEDDERWRAAVWGDGRYDVLISSAPFAPLGVASGLEDEVFSRIGDDLDRLTLVNGLVRRVPNVLQGNLLATLRVGDFSTAPFHGVASEGRIFILGHLRRSDAHLPITKIVADRVGAEIDRLIFLRRATEDAAARERTRIMRDLHDGLLQSLTAARAQIEALPADAKSAEAQLETARKLLRMEQQRLREFVDATLARGHQWSSLETLRLRTEETAELWGCSLSFVIDRPRLLVPPATLNELSLMLAEAVANAVRHGHAETIKVALTQSSDWLQVEVHDDGRGFSGATAASRTELAEDELPRSLCARVRDMGGRMQAWTSASGATLRFELPL